MNPRYPTLPVDRPEYNPVDYTNVFIDNVVDEYTSTTDSESETDENAEASIWPEFLELLTLAGITVNTLLFPAFQFFNWENNV